jgi:hypothetical protein
MAGLAATLSSRWREHGEPVALTILALLALSLPPLMFLELITGTQAQRLAIMIAWAAVLLLALRLPGMLRSERRRIALLGGLALAALIGSMGLQTAPQPVYAQDGLTFRAAPRINRDTFVALLQRGNSPAAGVGAELYDIVVDYGIDPAVALAFFRHESSYCTAGRCARNDLKNWGMQRRPIRAERSAGLVDGFVRYNSWQDSVRDWCELILGRYVGRGLDTVEKAVPVYAPQSDGNAPQSYISVIRRTVASWSGQRLTPLVTMPTYSEALDIALISETFSAAELTYRPTWAFHTYMLDQARAGKPLGAPLAESRIIDVGGQRYAVQVFALDTLYTPLAPVESETNWGDVRRLSDLILQATPAPAAAP